VNSRFRPRRHDRLERQATSSATTSRCSTARTPGSSASSPARMETGKIPGLLPFGRMDGETSTSRRPARPGMVYALVVGSAKTWEEIQKILPYEERQKEGFDTNAVFGDPLFRRHGERGLPASAGLPGAAGSVFAPFDTTRIGIRKKTAKKRPPMKEAPATLFRRASRRLSGGSSSVRLPRMP